VLVGSNMYRNYVTFAKRNFGTPWGWYECIEKCWREYTILLKIYILCIVGWNKKTVQKMHGTYIKTGKVCRILKKYFSSLRALYLEEENTLSSVSRLPLEDFPENLYIALKCATSNTCLVAIGPNTRVLHLKSNVLSSCILASIIGIFLKIHTSHLAHML